VLVRIGDESGAGPGVNVLEIGPGLGVVTLELAQRGARVVCVEADKSLEPVLRETLDGQSGVEAVFQDFLKLDLPGFLAERGEGKWTIVGNLPYYITTPIIAKLLEAKEHIHSALLMIQVEVAERLCAAPGSEQYGALSVFVQFHCEPRRLTRVSRNIFYPIPDVDSELVRLLVRDRPAVDVGDEKLFFKVVRAAFGKRRKTLQNALATSPELAWSKDETVATLDRAGIDGSRRGETLSIDEFARVCDADEMRRLI